MARRVITIDEKILKQQEIVEKVKEKYDTEVQKLNELMKKKDEEKGKEVLEAIQKSNKSYEDVLNFLNEGSQD